MSFLLQKRIARIFCCILLYCLNRSVESVHDSNQILLSSVRTSCNHDLFLWSQSLKKNLPFDCELNWASGCTDLQ